MSFHNKVIKLTFGELCIKTLVYNFISIWESDFLKEKVLS
jgi:hypothetical protein